MSAFDLAAHAAARLRRLLRATHAWPRVLCRSLRWRRARRPDPTRHPATAAGGAPPGGPGVWAAAPARRLSRSAAGGHQGTRRPVPSLGAPHPRSAHRTPPGRHRVRLAPARSPRRVGWPRACRYVPLMRERRCNRHARAQPQELIAGPLHRVRSHPAPARPQARRSVRPSRVGRKPPWRGAPVDTTPCRTRWVTSTRGGRRGGRIHRQERARDGPLPLTPSPTRRGGIGSRIP